MASPSCRHVPSRGTAGTERLILNARGDAIAHECHPCKKLEKRSGKACELLHPFRVPLTSTTWPAFRSDKSHKTPSREKNQSEHVMHQHLVSCNS